MPRPRAFVSALVVVSALLVPVTAAVASTPPSLDTTRVYANSTGVVTGHGFPAATVLHVTSSQPSLGVPDTVTTDGSGGLSVAYRASATLPEGGVDLTLDEGTPQGVFLVGHLTSGSAAIDTDISGPVIRQAGPAHVVLTGFAAHEGLTVSCTCSTTTASPPVTDAVGAATFDVRVSGPFRAADTVLRLVGALSGRTVSAPLTLSAAGALGPQEVRYLVSPDAMFSAHPGNGFLGVDETVGGVGTGWWSSGPPTQTDVRLFLQSDGNLVLRDTAGRAVWQSRTAGAGPQVGLTVQDDGNLVLRSAAGKALWASGTWLIALTAGQTAHPGQSLHGSVFAATMQTDGNLVVRDTYDVGNGAPPRVAWSTGTRSPGSTLTVQADGNLVVRARTGQAVWASHTNSRCPSPRLSQQFDGNLVLRSTTTGRACWSTGTALRGGLTVADGSTRAPQATAGSADQCGTCPTAAVPASPAAASGSSGRPVR